jgi:hypothetical protein
MATSTYPAQGGASNTTTLANFIPEIFSNEVKANFQCRLVMAGLVKSLPMTGKRGDKINIPSVSRGVSSSFAEGTAVTIQNDTAGNSAVDINQHWEYSRLVSDIAEMQALDSQRSFFVEDAGYTLAKRVDSRILHEGKSAGDGDGSSFVNSNSFFNDATNGITAYAVDTVTAADVVNDAFIRAMIQKQDDLDIPYDNRALVMPPSMKSTMLGIDRYVSSDFVSGRAVDNAKIGEIYGIPLYVTTNTHVTETAAENSAGGELKAAMLFHRDDIILAMQRDIRTQTQYKQEWLSDLVTSDVVFGTLAWKFENIFNIIVNA